MPISFSSIYNEFIYSSLPLEGQDRIRSGEFEQISRIPEPAAGLATLTAKLLQFREKTVGVPRKVLLDRPTSEIPCPLHQSFCEARISIPTLHVYSRDKPAILK